MNLSNWSRNCHASVKKFNSRSDSSKYGVNPEALGEQELILIKSFDQTEQYTLSEIPGVEPASSSELTVKSFLTNVASELPYKKELQFYHDKKLSMLGNLSQFMASTSSRPDAFIQLRQPGSTTEIPLLMVEVHSGIQLGSYSHTKNQAIIGLIDQLRLLRHFDRDITTCSGFVFPKLHNSEERHLLQAVNEIKIEWKNLHFFVSCIPLKKDDVRSRVLSIISEMYAYIKKLDTSEPLPSLSFLIPLSKSDIEELSASLQSDIHDQIKSRSSIIVFGSKFLYKHVPFTMQKATLSTLRGKKKALDFVITPLDELDCCNLTFFKFRMLPCLPLNVYDARKCLRKLIEGVYSALSELHAKLSLAHLDIRLENICFDADYHPVLIDLDRAKYKDSPAFSLLCENKIYGDSTLYNQPCRIQRSEWIMQHSDFRQFGIMIWWILNKGCFDYHNCTGPDYQKDPFVKELVDAGTYDSGLLADSSYDKNSMEEVCRSLMGLSINNPASTTKQLS